MQKGWSFDKKDWSKLPNFLLESQWKLAKFNTQEVNLIPSKPGIYMFSTSIPLNVKNRLQDIK